MAARKKAASKNVSTEEAVASLQANGTDEAAPESKEIPAAIVERAAHLEANPATATETTPPASDIKYENRPQDEGDVDYIGVRVELTGGDHEKEKGTVQKIIEHDDEGKATKVLFSSHESPNTLVVIDVEDVQIENVNAIDNEEVAAAEEEAAAEATPEETPATEEESKS